MCPSWATTFLGKSMPGPSHWALGGGPGGHHPLLASTHPLAFCTSTVFGLLWGLPAIQLCLPTGCPKPIPEVKGPPTLRGLSQLRCRGHVRRGPAEAEVGSKPRGCQLTEGLSAFTLVLWLPPGLPESHRSGSLPARLHRLAGGQTLFPPQGGERAPYQPRAGSPQNDRGTTVGLFCPGQGPKANPQGSPGVLGLVTGNTALAFCTEPRSQQWGWPRTNGCDPLCSCSRRACHPWAK